MYINNIKDTTRVIQQYSTQIHTIERTQPTKSLSKQKNTQKTHIDMKGTCR